jgi:hypothetical protein
LLRFWRKSKAIFHLFTIIKIYFLPLTSLCTWLCTWFVIKKNRFWKKLWVGTQRIYLTKFNKVNYLNISGGDKIRSDFEEIVCRRWDSYICAFAILIFILIRSKNYFRLLNLKIILSTFNKVSCSLRKWLMVYIMYVQIYFYY